MHVAFQGEPGAYSEEAIFEHFGTATRTKPCETFEGVFASIASGAAEYGIIPIENSLAGSIHRNYDLLLRYPLIVVGEHHLNVHHCLIARPGVELSEIRRVISHPQALAQCDAYLNSLSQVKAEAAYDTAGSVKIVWERDDRSLAAIASRRAAELYEMHILAENIEDYPANVTRFLIISRNPVEPGEDAKTSIVFALKNEPGSLFKALSVFALRDIDLTKIESRPLVGKPWEYLFYIDFAGSAQEQSVIRALSHLDEYATFLRVLGSYPRDRVSL